MKPFRITILMAVLLSLFACTPRQAEPLIIYSGRGEDLIGPIVQAFRDSSGMASAEMPSG